LIVRFAFYRDVLGFELTQRYDTQAAFLLAGGWHHRIGLNTWDSECGSAPPLSSTGLYHLAIAYSMPSRADEFFELAFASKAPQIMGMRGHLSLRPR
jgi:catechol 2,3-dioxygenase